jgi:alkanesulfonate monooxygenase SsuD/methylene tetrahydromethanopterin reductase-like flavin-dependent oxidoreductase (luciferase family)
MRLGLMLGYAAGKIELPLELVKEADRLGVYAVWTAEAYGSDAVSPLAWLGAQTEQIKLGTAIMQMPGRTPANAAMTAMTLNQLSNGRFLMGLGLSGPQVVEGWHGVSYKRPLTRTREYVDIVRTIFRRQERLQYDGGFTRYLIRAMTPPAWANRSKAPSTPSPTSPSTWPPSARKT